MNISFIGFGHMAKALAQPLVNNQAYRLFATAPSLPIGINAQGIHTHFNNLAFLNDSNIIILAVKPAQMPAVLTQIKDHIPNNAIIISIAAGRQLNWIANCIQRDIALIRAMPNIAAAIGQSATPLFANSFVTDEQKAIVTTLFSSVGLTAWIDMEEDINAFTALSGSGCAYVLLFMEALVEGAHSIGLSNDIATSFALQTVLGTALLAKTTKKEFTDLRASVTSVSGTTAAAIATLTNLNFTAVMQQAMNAAYERAQQLSQ